MTINDILSAANTSGYSSRFRRWLAFCLKWECVINSDGHIRGRDEKDGAGVTFAGLTERDDDIPDDPTPIWVAYTYREKYWVKSHAETMPLNVGEVVANYALNCGHRRASKFLQSALVDLGNSLAVDGKTGPQTIAATWKVKVSKDLAVAVVAKGEAFYRRIGIRNRARFLKGWLNRNADLRATFCA
jgi:hypothetical protein